jgi:hypothetical protein
MSDPQQGVEEPPTQPPAVPAVPAVPVDADGAGVEGDGRQESVAEPAKLLRIASMVRELLDETRQASISSDLKDELEQLAPPMEGVPSESELRIAQAQLVGWLEGLFHGIQAAMFAQQAAARAQFEELRRRGLMAQNPQPGDQQQQQQPPQRGGQYL